MTSYVVNDRARPTNEYLNALVWDGQHWQNYFTAGGANVITYFFDNDVSTWTEAEKASYRAALQSWADVANLVFAEVSVESQANLVEHSVPNSTFTPDPGTVTFADHETPQLAVDEQEQGRFNYQTYSYQSNGGTLVYDETGLAVGGEGYATFVHELGHALGLAHPHDNGGGSGVFPGVTSTFGDLGDNNLNQSVYTVMSYNQFEQVPGDSSYGYYRGPMAFDIAAIQYLYGASIHNTGNNSYILPDTDGAGTYWTCIWDTAGRDDISYGGNGDATIDLRAATLDNSDIGGGALSSVFDHNTHVRIHGGFTIANGVLIEDANGGNGDDTLLGNSALNYLNGNGGNDTLNGRGGFDYLYGGTGNDIFQLYDVNGGLYDNVSDLSGASGGTDAVWVRQFAGGPTSYTLGSYIEIGAITDPSASGFTLNGNELANTLYDDIGSNNLFGAAGNDLLDGGAGNDTLDGGADSDTLQGNVGNDIYHLYDVSGGAYDTVVENFNGGSDTVLVMDVSSSVRSYTMTGNVETGAIVGHNANNFALHGNNLNNTMFDDIGGNTLYGEGGNDTLNGGDGLDNLIGGIGNDVYQLVDRDSTYGFYDTVIEGTSEGNDRIEFTAIHYDGLNDYYVMPSEVERLDMSGAVNFDIYGNSGNNIITGNSANNVLYGDVSNVYGIYGNDKLDGGSGDDTLVGSGGDDDYFLSDLTYSDGITLTHYDAVVENANGGTDTVYVLAIDDPDTFYTDGYTLGANVENGQITGSLAFNLEGNELNNRLTGNDGANTLYGLAGNDTLMYSGDGFHGGGDTLDGGADTDTASFANETVGVTANLATGTATGAAGTDTLVSIENLTGGSGDDHLTGDGSVNVLDGGGGSDILTGGGGADVMRGGFGNDSYDVDDAGDVVVEGYLGGTDYVTAAVNYTLGGNVENLTLYGYAGNINGTGNGLDNTIIGNRGNNVLLGLGGADYLFGGDLGNDTLDGGAGADRMEGLAGNDNYVVDNAGDIVDESIGGSGGTDAIYSSVISVNLGDTTHYRGSIENAVLNGSANLNLIGSGLANTLVGNGGVNTLNGGAGADYMRGMAGNDSYFVDNAGDIADESVAGSGGADAVYSSVISINLADAAHFKGSIETAVLQGASNLNLTGNSLANTLVGNAGNNILNGGAGADYMRGGAGNDSYIIDNAGDIADESIGGSGGTDAIYSSAISINLGDTAHYRGTIENAVLQGASNLNLIGTGLNNLLVGNSGNNVFDGRLGADTMVGGAGNDVFRFDTALGGGNVDRITDYTVANDQFQIDNAIFTGLANGALAVAAFFTGAAAHDADDHIIYNSATGALFFDSDGTGATAQIQFASLSAGLAMAASEFTVI